MSADLLRRLQECEGITRGQWRVDRTYGPESRVFGVYADGHGYIVAPHSKTTNPTVDAEHEANINMIALAPELRDEVLRLRRLIVELVAAIDEEHDAMHAVCNVARLSAAAARYEAAMDEARKVAKESKSG